MVRDGVWAGEHCEFYQLSTGLRVTYDRATHEYIRFDFHGEPIDDNKIYKVGLQQFHFNNLEDFFAISLDEVSENGKPVVISTSCRSIFDEYLSNHQNLDRDITGRLVII
jgi:5'-nucleotidase